MVLTTFPTLPIKQSTAVSVGKLLSYPGIDENVFNSLIYQHLRCLQCGHSFITLTTQCNEYLITLTMTAALSVITNYFDTDDSVINNDNNTN